MLLDFLQFGFMQRAFIAGILIALICGVIGVFLVLRRMSLLGDGLAHISFGGIAAGMLFGVYPLLSALVFSVLGAVGIQKLKQMKIYGDAAIAIFFAFGLSIGVVIVSVAHGFNADLFSYLFGSILAVSQADIILIAVIGIATIVILLLFYKELFYITFDEESAKAAGLPVENISNLLVILTAIAVVLSMRIVGILLVSSFIVIPASTALLICRGFKQAIAVAAAIGVLSVIAGLVFAYYFDLAAGGAIVLTLIIIFTIVLIYKNLRKK